VRASSRLLLIAVAAALLASADLAVKATVPTPWPAFHHRSAAWIALCVAVLFALFSLAVVPSRAVAIAAGVASGGVIGNLVSAIANGNRVPNPLVIGGYGHLLAFNLADVFFLVGNLLLMTSLVLLTVRNRDRLAPPRAWERAVLRQLRLGR
jgi:hypothetical protein